MLACPFSGPDGEDNGYFEVTLPASITCAASIAFDDRQDTPQLLLREGPPTFSEWQQSLCCRPELDSIVVGLDTGHIQIHNLQAALLHRQRIHEQAVVSIAIGSSIVTGVTEACLSIASAKVVACTPISQVCPLMLVAIAPGDQESVQRTSIAMQFAGGWGTILGEAVRAAASAIGQTWSVKGRREAEMMQMQRRCKPRCRVW